MKNAIVSFVAILVTTTVALAHESLQGPTETIQWDRERAYNGYTLFSARGTSYLIDMEGQVINTWPIGTTPQFLDNGNLLDASKDDPSGFGDFANSTGKATSSGRTMSVAKGTRHITIGSASTIRPWASQPRSTLRTE